MPGKAMAGGSRCVSAGLFVFLLLFSNSSSLLLPSEETNTLGTFDPEWVKFDLRDDVYQEAHGVLDASTSEEQRGLFATTPIGTFDASGLTLDRPVPENLLAPRFDVLMLIVSNGMPMTSVRADLNQIAGLEVREFISPSGLMVQGLSLIHI